MFQILVDTVLTGVPGSKLNLGYLFTRCNGALIKEHVYPAVQSTYSTLNTYDVEVIADP